jgi:hypothetical protein
MTGAAYAQPASNASPNGAGARGAQSNGKISRTIAETGARLARSRVCKTREEWAEQRRETRQNIDRAQTTRTNPGGN